MKYLISACLVGDQCRYNGTGKTDKLLKKMIDDQIAIKACPELLGGLSVPRKPCEIMPESKRIVTKEGEDVTNAFREGAKKTLDLCKKYGIKNAILQERSPSCGSGCIYDGSFSGKLVPGQGVTAEILREYGISVVSYEQWRNQDQIS